MNFLDAFHHQADLIHNLGEGNAYLVWIMAIYLDAPDSFGLASESLTDSADDKKIDFIRFDRDAKRIVFSQGYYSLKKKDKAPANKASDLNTAAAWLFSGDLDGVPRNLKSIIAECRKAIANDDVDQIDLLYVHNLPESVNVARELITAAQHIDKILPVARKISVIHRELGLENADRLYASKGSPLLVRDEIECPSAPILNEKGDEWRSAIMSVPGAWLREQFHKHGEDLFSANYRGFLGISKRKKINSGIRSTAENSPSNFWAFNNGITILTNKFSPKNGGTLLSGMSIINGAQTTGSLGSIDSSQHPLSNLRVLCRLIECSDPTIIGDIVKYNNTQNEITTWDQYSNSPEQRRIQQEFSELGHDYSLKRGYEASNSRLGIEVVAQPLIALEGGYVDANRGKNVIFERQALYKKAFESKKARHILFAFTLARAIDEFRLVLKQKYIDGSIIDIESNQLLLFRNLRFRNFFISIIGRCLEQILGQGVDVGLVAFIPEFSNARNKTFDELVAIWLPIVGMVLVHIVAVSNQDISEIMGKSNGLDDIALKVGALIYASQLTGIPNSIEIFRKTVSAKG